MNRALKIPGTLAVMVHDDSKSLWGDSGYHYDTEANIAALKKVMNK